MTSLKRINPSMIVHSDTTMLTKSFSPNVRVPKISNNIALRSLLHNAGLASIVRVVAILVPLVGLNNYGFFSKFHRRCPFQSFGAVFFIGKVNQRVLRFGVGVKLSAVLSGSSELIRLSQIFGYCKVLQITHRM